MAIEAHYEIEPAKGIAMTAFPSILLERGNLTEQL